MYVVGDPDAFEGYLCILKAKAAVQATVFEGGLRAGDSLNLAG